MSAFHGKRPARRRSHAYQALCTTAAAGSLSAALMLTGGMGSGTDRLCNSHQICGALSVINRGHKTLHFELILPRAEFRSVSQTGPLLI